MDFYSISTTNSSGLIESSISVSTNIQAVFNSNH